MINDSEKVKFRINMITKSSSRKQIIAPIDNDNKSKFITSLCHKLHSACISTTSGLIFTNQVVLESPKWGLSAHMWEVQEQ